MSGSTGMFHIVSAVIAASGVAKLISPDAFVGICRVLHIPMARFAARLVGVTELAVGVWAVLVGGRVAGGVVAVAYLVFAVMVMAARRAGAPSCGCFGAVPAPPGMTHAVVDLASATVAVVAAASGNVTGLPDTLRLQPAFGVPYLLAVVTGVALVIAIDTVGADLVAALTLHRQPLHT